MIDWTEFNRCQKWLEDALEYNDTGLTIEDVRRGLVEGKYSFLPGRNCAVVLEHYETPKGKHLNYFLAAGNFAELESMLKPVEAWAKDIGVTRITVFGRRGWEKSFLKDNGYRPHWVVLTKDL